MSILQVISLGNDIVDLFDPDTVHLIENPRFLKKVFNQSELDAVSQTPVNLQHRHLWKLWAAKEASYKAVKRLRSDVVFSPQKFGFQMNLSKVIYQDISCVLHFTESTDYIYAWAIINKDDASESYDREIKKNEFKVSPCEEQTSVQNWIAEFSDVEKMLNENKMEKVPSYSKESSLCRNFANLKIASYIQETKVCLEKNSTSRSSIPEIWINNAKTNHLVSTSHHGRYCAVMFYPK